MKKVYFVRHGQSEYNLKKISSGSIDTILTELGKKQALETGELLRGKNITHIVSSDLSRAYETALGIKSIIDKHDNIVLDKAPLLQEVFFGDIQGKPYIPGTSGLKYAIESGTGESAEVLHIRAQKALDYINSIQTKGNILVVGHGSFTSVIFAVSEGKTKDDIIEYRSAWNFKNGEIKEKIL